MRYMRCIFYELGAQERKQMITTRELARLAGVSQSTVSRSLSDSHEISAETKERIRNLAKEHGYIVRKSKKKIYATSERKVIAVLISEKDEMDAYLVELYNIIVSCVTKENYFPMLLSGSDESILEKVHDFTRAGLVEGYIVIKRMFDPQVERYLADLKIPHVYLHYFERYSLETIDVIDSDQYLGGYLATQHLIGLGHKKILTLTSKGRAFGDRTSGYREAMREADLNVTDDDVVFIPRTIDGGYEYIMEHAGIEKQYTAVFVQNDTSALGCISALGDRGVKVPEEISVIGYDGIEHGRICRPKLTTVDQMQNKLCTLTVERLLHRIDRKKDNAIHMIVQPSLLIRESTGRAPE